MGGALDKLIEQANVSRETALKWMESYHDTSSPWSLEQAKLWLALYLADVERLKTL